MHHRRSGYEIGVRLASVKKIEHARIRVHGSGPNATVTVVYAVDGFPDDEVADPSLREQLKRLSFIDSCELLAYEEELKKFRVGKVTEIRSKISAGLSLDDENKLKYYICLII